MPIPPLVIGNGDPLLEVINQVEGSKCIPRGSQPIDCRRPASQPSGIIKAPVKKPPQPAISGKKPASRRAAASNNPLQTRITFEPMSSGIGLASNAARAERGKAVVAARETGIRAVAGFVNHQPRMQIPLPTLRLTINRQEFDFTDLVMRHL